MKDTWLIWIAGYGSFEFEGTEAEAEEMRGHKARWERGQGRKYRLTNQRPSDLAMKKIVDIWAAGEGVPQRLLTAYRKAIDAEAKPDGTHGKFGDSKFGVVI